MWNNPVWNYSHSADIYKSSMFIFYIVINVTDWLLVITLIRVDRCLIHDRGNADQEPDRILNSTKKKRELRAMLSETASIILL